jgi:hypothetical protein
LGAFCHNAHVSLSHRSNSIWRSRSAFAMVVMLASPPATARKAG